MLKLEYAENNRLFVWFGDKLIFNWGPFDSKIEAFACAQSRLESVFQEALTNIKTGLFQQKAVRVKAIRITPDTKGLTGTPLGLMYGVFLVAVGDWVVDGHVYTNEQFTKRFDPI